MQRTPPVTRAPVPGGRLFLRKPAEAVAAEARSGAMLRRLGAVQLTLLGIGSIIGAGIYVMTGNAAASFAGPGVLLSFVLAGVACGFAALCYAELASAMPVSGSAYTYAYATLGELPAWVIGWLMLLEFGIAGAAVSTGLAGYLSSLLGSFGIVVPAGIRSPLVEVVAGPGGDALRWNGGINLVAVAAIALVVAVLVRGVAESARANAVIVAVKLGVLVLFVVFGAHAVRVANLEPFIPPNEGGFRFGVPGVLRAASVIFFAYMGFETVSTAGAEARDPQRDMPRGIIAALLVSTVFYLVVALVLVGAVPFRELGVPDPLAIAVDAMGLPQLAVAVKLGAVAGLSSVLLAVTYGQSRILYSMARDGLVPPLFARLHPVRRTPAAGTVVLGCCMAIAAAFLPIGIIGDLVSLGTTGAFGIVCATVIWHRNRFPDASRVFRVPGGGVRMRGMWIGVVPVLGVLFSALMATPLLVDLVRGAFGRNPLPFALLSGYGLLGALVYAGYGFRRSRLGRGLPPIGPAEGEAGLSA
ncbi:MAG: amino acid permease [Gluconacetobacter diazotrophicus]|nr:amino acid permease [Gluconacetobacter diazotrophicus]